MGYYCLIHTPMIWQATENVCKNHDGHLVTVRNTSINTQLVSLMSEANITEVWIGAKLQRGHWKWVNGESLS